MIFKSVEIHQITTIHPCQSAGLDRKAVELQCNMQLECTPDGKPSVLIISDFAHVVSLHAELGAFIEDTIRSRGGK